MKKKVLIILVCFVGIFLSFMYFVEKKEETLSLSSGPAGSEILMSRVDKALTLADIVISAGESNLSSLDDEARQDVQSIIKEVQKKHQELLDVRIKISPDSNNEILQKLEEKVGALETELEPLVR